MSLTRDMLRRKHFWILRCEKRKRYRCIPGMGKKKAPRFEGLLDDRSGEILRIIPPTPCRISPPPFSGRHGSAARSSTKDASAFG